VYQGGAGRRAGPLVDHTALTSDLYALSRRPTWPVGHGAGRSYLVPARSPNLGASPGSVYFMYTMSQ